MQEYSAYYDSIAPDAALKKRILSAAAKSTKKRWNKYIPAMAAAAAVLLCAALPFALKNYRDSIVIATPDISAQPMLDDASRGSSAPESENVIAPGTPQVSHMPETESYIVINSLSDVMEVDASTPSACYRAPKEGETLYYTEVSLALETGNFSENTLFFVGIDVFDGSERLIAGSEALAAVIDAFRALGYHVEFSVCWEYGNEDEDVPIPFLSGLFTPGELEAFTPPEGYAAALYFPKNGDGSPVEPDIDLILNQSSPSAEETPEADPYMCSGLPLPPEGITLEAALSNPDFGKYIPDFSSAGWTFESAYKNGGLSLFWSRGYDSISWNASLVSKDVRELVVSPDEKEKYDMSLYSVPFADSVPEELREVVSSPVFLIDELTLQMVEARAYSVQDAGDTPEVRMSFSVIYGDTVVSINSKGISAEDVYDILTGLKQ